MSEQLIYAMGAGVPLSIVSSPLRSEFLRECSVVRENGSHLLSHFVAICAKEEIYPAETDCSESPMAREINGMPHARASKRRIVGTPASASHVRAPWDMDRERGIGRTPPAAR